LMLIGVLLGLAFFTLIERKVMGYVHFRKGPNKLFYFGLLQPIRDAIKLFNKEFLKVSKINFFIFLFSPLFGLFLMFILWLVYLRVFGVFGSLFSLLYIFGMMRLGVYFLLGCGWSSGRKYSLLGGFRGVSQTISYEVVIIFFIMLFIYFIGFYDLGWFFYFQIGIWFLFLRFTILLGWLYVCLAELNRRPFDFSEGESELVSGFNVEYRGGLFSFIFICEYGMILFFGFFTVSIFFGSVDFFFKIVFFCLFIVLIRCGYPRYRYDFLMYGAWKYLLPFILCFLLIFVVYFKFSRKVSY
jgi:NADH-ubiquinone oxidoreductase chain 1